MSLKLKALGLGLIAAMAMSAVAVMNASATSTGEFHAHTNTADAIIEGFEGLTHKPELTSHGLSGGIVCDEATYKGTAAKTTKHITIIPTYNKCYTTGGTPGEVTVTVNGCSYTFTPGHNGTVHLDCPVGKGIEVTHPNCRITITAQTTTGVKYTAVNDGGRDAITIDIANVQFNTEYHGPYICVFTGTNHVGTLNGSVLVRGYDDNAGVKGIQQNITATPITP